MTSLSDEIASLGGGTLSGGKTTLMGGVTTPSEGGTTQTSGELAELEEELVSLRGETAALLGRPAVNPPGSEDLTGRVEGFLGIDIGDGVTGVSTAQTESSGWKDGLLANTVDE